MPIKINELIIKARILDEDSQSKQDSNSSSMLDSAMIIRECVDQVMEIINDKKER